MPAKYSQTCREAMHNALLLRKNSADSMDCLTGARAWQWEGHRERTTEAKTKEQVRAAYEEAIAHEEKETQRFLALDEIAYAAFTCSNEAVLLLGSANDAVAEGLLKQDGFLAWKTEYSPALMELYLHVDFVPPPIGHRYSHDSSELIKVNLDNITAVLSTSPLLNHTSFERYAETAKAVERLIEAIHFGVKRDTVASQQADKEYSDLEMPGQTPSSSATMSASPCQTCKVRLYPSLARSLYNALFVPHESLASH